MPKYIPSRYYVIAVLHCMHVAPQSCRSPYKAVGKMHESFQVDRLVH